jgi:hypothetical protein
MPTYGPYYASNVISQGSSGSAWSNLSGAAGTAGTGANISSPSVPTFVLVATDFRDAGNNPVDVASSDTVVGVTCAVTKMATQASGSKNATDEYAGFYWYYSQYPTLADTTDRWPTTAAATTYGSATGTYASGFNPLLPNMCSDPTFGFGISANPTSGFTGDVYVYEFVLYVYTTGAPGPVPAPLFPPGALGIGPTPAGLTNQQRRTRIEGTRFQYR